MSTKNFLHVAFALLALVALTEPANAYIGPGLGAGAIGAVLGVIGAVLLGIFAIVYYPLKRLLQKKRRTPEVGKTAGAPAKK